MKSAFAAVCVIMLVVVSECFAQTSAPAAADSRQERLLVRLQHTPAANLAETISKSFNSGGVPIVNVVPIPASNCLLISAPSETLQEISKLLATLDSKQKEILVDVWFVELQGETAKRAEGRSSAASTDLLAAGKRSDVLEKLHQLEKDGRATIVHHFQLTTLESNPAFAQQGERRPRGTSTSTTAPGRTSTTFENIGTIVQVNARASTDNLITLQVDAQKSFTAPDAKSAAPDQQAKVTDRSETRATNNIAILGQSTVRIASGNIVSLTGVTSTPSEQAGSYQILVSAEVLPTEAEGR